MTEEKTGIFEALRTEWAKWRDTKGREGQHHRWQLRRNEKRLAGDKVRLHKGTRRGDSKGAFGTRKDVNREPALTPAEMRARYGEKK